MIPTQCNIRRVHKEARDTYTLSMVPVGRQVAAFEPGQFNMVYVPGVGEVPISISGDGSDSSSIVHTVRSVGTVSAAICAQKRGGVLGIRGPFGSSWPVKAAEGNDIVIVAGGIGLAPLRPAFYHVLANREKYGRVALLYGARTPVEMLFVDELEKWRGRFDVQVEVTVDNAWSDWHGHVGVVTTLIPHVSFDPSETVAMVCGPEVMMRFTVNSLLKREVPAERVFLSFERNMKCGIGLCGHCQYGPKFICKDGPIFPYSEVEALMKIREL